MRTFTIFSSNFFHNPRNKFYRHRIDVTCEADFRDALQQDYVCAEYRDGHRSCDNFISSDCAVMDIDNTHSDEPDDWMTPEDVAIAFPGVCYAIHYSRNHMKEKDGRAARPKFHVFFPIEKTESVDEYTTLKKKLKAAFPVFDSQALDAAHFFFGTEDPAVEFHDSPWTITRFFENERLFEEMPDAPIQQGNRNTTMHRFAVRILKRYGDTEGALAAYHQTAERCDPPLDDSELGSIWNSALKFYAKIRKQIGYIDPERFNADGYRPDDFSDVGQAVMLSSVFADELRYTPATGYLRYLEGHWQESETSAQDAAQMLTSLQLKEARDLKSMRWTAFEETDGAKLLEEMPRTKAIREMEDDQRQAYYAYEDAKSYEDFVIGRRSSKNIASTLKEARPMVSIDVESLDSDGFILCTPEGSYDLRQGLAGKRENSPSDLCTKSTAVAPGAAGTEIWNQCLEKTFCGNAELIEYVQMICGLAAIGKVFIESLIIAYGGGRNGKSTFWNTVSRVLGSYSGNISADTLTAGCIRNVKPEMAEARGKRLMIAAEMREGARLNESMIKQLCSTDDVYAEKKYKDPFAFKPCHTLVLYTNHLPRVGASDEGTWRRLIVIPFTAHFEGSSDVKNYADHLFSKAGGAVLSWIIEGARKVIEREFRLDLPACVREAIDEYHNSNDWLRQFIEDCCMTGNDLEVSSSDLYQAHRNHAQSLGEYAKRINVFNDAIEKAGFRRVIRNRKRYVCGLQLIPEDSPF